LRRSTQTPATGRSLSRELLVEPITITPVVDSVSNRDSPRSIEYWQDGSTEEEIRASVE